LSGNARVSMIYVVIMHTRTRVVVDLLEDITD
jgi:hypothetical protein